MADSTSSSDAEYSSDTAASNASTAESASTLGEDGPMTTSASGSSAAPESTEQARGGVSQAPMRSAAGNERLRNGVASVVWLLAVLAALILAVGTLLIALDASSENTYVSWVLDAADRIDWFFWKIFEMKDRTQNHLINWGLAAVAYLIVGRIADRLIRP